MKREDIKSILEKAGVTDENMKDALDSIFAENGKDIEAERTKVTEAKDKELQTANDTIKNLQKTIKDFDGVDVEKLKKDAADWKTKYDTDIKAAQDQTKKLAMEYALKDSLREAGVLDADYVIYKQGGLDGFTFDKEGKPVGITELVEPLKKSSPQLFKAAGPAGGYDPAAGGGAPTNNPFAKDTYNLTEQGRLLKENPARAKELASAAGITI